MAKDCFERGCFNDVYDAREECRRLEQKYGSVYKEFLCHVCGKWHVRDTKYQEHIKSSRCVSRFGRPKDLFMTRAEAEEALFNNISGATGYYYCQKCKGFHLTSHPRDKKGLRK